MLLILLMIMTIQVSSINEYNYFEVHYPQYSSNCGLKLIVCNINVIFMTEIM